ncbi:hypothetical protein A3K72_01600 [Candidatus Woesearchaeota archaeon RBG_13_36_6]|nr:MAG: hypothetical protein A3K72_01600 [Candidatus Woesearchaeota archaeon RBG_13_36_6]
MEKKQLEIIGIVSAILAMILGAIGINYFWTDNQRMILYLLSGVGFLSFLACFFKIQHIETYEEGFQHGFKSGEQEGWNNAMRSIKERYKE